MTYMLTNVPCELKADSIFALKGEVILTRKKLVFNNKSKILHNIYRVLGIIYVLLTLVVFFIVSVIYPPIINDTVIFGVIAIIGFLIVAYVWLVIYLLPSAEFYPKIVWSHTDVVKSDKRTCTLKMKNPEAIIKFEGEDLKKVTTLLKTIR